MNITPPIAKRIPKKLSIHGDTRVDEFYWLNERDNQEVIDYLNAENKYYDAMTAHTEKLQSDLFEEMKGRIKEDDESVPYKSNGYYYITKYVKGGQYPIYSRRKGSLDAKSEVIFDVNKMAEGFEYFKMRGINISPNNELAAFGVDKVSRRIYDIQIKNLKTGELYDDILSHTTGSVTWASDNKTLFYTKQDEVTLRGYKIYRHVLGTSQSEDVEVFHEEDDTFNTFVYKTKSKKYLVIGCFSTVSTEYRVLEADNPTGVFRVIQQRERDLEYGIAHYEDHFYLLTNKDQATNFKLMKTSVEKTEKENWVDVIPHREDVLLEDISIYKDFLVLEERSNGLNKIRIIRWDKSADYYLPFDEETYSVGVYESADFDTAILRYAYNSMTTPASVIDFDMNTHEKEVKKEQEVLGGKFDKSNYTSKRIWATASDGKKVAVSLVYNHTLGQPENRPLLLYAYGSYGHTIDDGFSTTRLSLLDRGFIFAIAHIRGGEYLGRQWYEDGKLLAKTNTFTDFITCGEYLISEGYTTSQKIYGMGGSAGGLLIGAVINMRPDLFHGVIAAVPFVDVVTTMLDDSIPLTTGEYDEWGNPNVKEYYDYMKSYSPYDNVKDVLYPHLLVTTGLHDSQVQYFEPAKWVAKIRQQDKNRNKVLLKIDMNVGHGGASGRFDSLKDTALEYAFLLDLESNS